MMHVPLRRKGATAHCRGLALPLRRFLGRRYKAVSFEYRPNNQACPIFRRRGHFLRVFLQCRRVRRSHLWRRGTQSPILHSNRRNLRRYRLLVRRSRGRAAPLCRHREKPLLMRCRDVERQLHVCACLFQQQGTRNGEASLRRMRNRRISSIDGRLTVGRCSVLVSSLFVLIE